MAGSEHKLERLKEKLSELGRELEPYFPALKVAFRRKKILLPLGRCVLRLDLAREASVELTSLLATTLRVLEGREEHEKLLDKLGRVMTRFRLLASHDRAAENLMKIVSTYLNEKYTRQEGFAAGLAVGLALGLLLHRLLVKTEAETWLYYATILRKYSAMLRKRLGELV